MERDITVSSDGCKVTIETWFDFRNKWEAIKKLGEIGHGKITTTELAKAIEQRSPKIKRHTRELLGHDESAGRRTGYSRKLTLEESIRVYVYGVLIQVLSQQETKRIVEHVISQLKIEGEL